MYILESAVYSWVTNIQWGDSEEIDWPEGLDHSGAIDITSGSGGGSSDPVTMNVGTVTTGAAGSSASANITDNGNNSFTLNMNIPRGQNGTDGTSPVFSSTTTTSTLSAGSSATASISGSGTSSSPYKFSFGIPRGYTGSTGSQGPTGPSAISNYSLGSAAGYIVLNNGFKIQWKNIPTVTGTTGATAVTPPINFTTFSFILSEPISGTKTTDNSQTPTNLTMNRSIGANVVNSNTLNNFYIYHSTSTVRYVVMLGV